MTFTFRAAIIVTALTALAACGSTYSKPRGVHALGATQGCGASASPYLGADPNQWVRCTPQTLSPW